VGYEVAITRANATHSSARHPIPKSEWLALAESDEELTATPEAVYFRSKTEHQPVPLWWREGRVVAKSPSPATIAKLRSLAERLSANVYDDDGERFWPIESSTTEEHLVATLVDVSGPAEVRRGALDELAAMRGATARRATSALLRELRAIGDPMFLEDCPEIVTLLRAWRPSVEAMLVETLRGETIDGLLISKAIRQALGDSAPVKDAAASKTVKKPSPKRASRRSKGVPAGRKRHG
jgi:hypothetical protein